MLSISGNPNRNCEGLSRRQWLQVGGLGTLGLGLNGLLSGRDLSAAGDSGLPGFGRAKSCIVLFMFGAPAHQDTWDLKPDAPSEVRGEFKPIATNVTGLQVSEHIPMLSKMADRYSLIRSVTHPDNTHTVAMHYMLSGVRHKRPKTNPQNASDDFPCFGAVMNYVRNRQRHSANGGVSLPPAISLNAPANQVSANNHIFPGFFAGQIGTQHDPLFISQHANAKNFQPFPKVESSDRLIGRRRLLQQFQRQSQQLQQVATQSGIDHHTRQAFELLTSPATARAFDLSRESEKLRDRYGRTPFGQGCLLARRLVESGVSLTTVNWQRDDAFWDTHKNNFKDHKEKLLPNMDRGYSALLEDLQQRGLLEETLVVWLGEFGRTPKINSNAGRDHWAACNTVALAGAGIPGGYVHGASDRSAAYPTRDAVGPEDLAATMYHLLGIDPGLTLYDAQNRPARLSHGRPIAALL